jgi:hypothetical protein
MARIQSPDELDDIFFRLPHKRQSKVERGPHAISATLPRFPRGDYRIHRQLACSLDSREGAADCAARSRDGETAPAPRPS